MNPWGTAVVLAACVVVASCSSGSGKSSSGSGSFDPIPSGCPSDYDCPAGQTCYSPLATASTWICVASGPGQAGDACSPASNTVQCGDKLACVGSAGSSGRCYFFCDPTHPCPSGSGSCTQFNTVNGYSLTMCL